jgi:hypothetical protein
MKKRMNIEHPTFNIQFSMKGRIHCLYFDFCFSLKVQSWTFDLPEADKCLLAFGELDVDIHLLPKNRFPDSNVNSKISQKMQRELNSGVKL